MYTVWTRPSTAGKIKKGDAARMQRTTGKAVTGIMSPVITRGILGSVAPVPLGGTISLTATSGGALLMVKDMEDNMKSSSERSSVSHKFGNENYYLHGTHSIKGKAESQASALRKVKYKVRITKA